MPDYLMIPTIVAAGALLTLLSVYLLRDSRVRVLGASLRILMPILLLTGTVAGGWYLQKGPPITGRTSPASANETRTTTFAPGAESQERIKSLMADGNGRLASGDPQGALEFFGEAATIAIEIQDMQLAARVFTSLADCYVILGDIDQAREYYRDQALPVFTNPDMALPRGEALVRRSLGDLERKLGHPDSARVHYERARELAISLSDTVGEAITLHGLGALELALGEPDSARAYFLRADTLFLLQGHMLGSSNILHALGDLEFALDQDSAAEQYYTSALVLARQVRFPLAEANALYGLGNCAVRAKDHANANDHLTMAKKIYDRISNPLGQANVATAMGDLLADQGEKIEAAKQYRLAKGLYRNLKMPNRVRLLEIKRRYVTGGQDSP